MTQIWHTLSARIDSLTLRERAMLFAAAAAAIIFAFFFFFLNPHYARHKSLLVDMARQQQRLAGVDADIAATMQAHMRDPDAAVRTALAQVRADTELLRTALGAQQEAMVAPERMGALLEQLLREQRGLKLRSMRTLGENKPEAEPGAALASGALPAPQLLHRHGVELVLEGSYPDMVAYMDALEHMHGRVFWDRAALVVESYPVATLTLTLYTINLDKKWLRL